MHMEDTWITNSKWYYSQNTYLLRRKHYNIQHQRVRYNLKNGTLWENYFSFWFCWIKWNTISVDILNICMLSYNIMFIQRIVTPTTTTTTIRKVYTNRYLFSFPLASISSIIKGSIIRKMPDDVEFIQYPALAAVTTSILLHHKTYTSHV